MKMVYDSTPTQANKDQQSLWQPAQVNEGASGDRNVPRQYDTLFGLRYVFLLIFFILLLMTL